MAKNVLKRDETWCSAWHLLDPKTNVACKRHFQVNHSNFANRMTSCRRCSIQDFHVSTLDCWVLANSGGDAYGELGFDSGEDA